MSFLCTVRLLLFNDIHLNTDSGRILIFFSLIAAIDTEHIILLDRLEYLSIKHQ